MAITATPITDLITGLGLIHDTDAEGTLIANCRNGATKVFALDIDNSANAAVSYLKIYDAASATVGTTDPDWVLPATASGRRFYIFTEDDAVGMTLTTAASYACTTGGGTGGTTSPTSAVVLNGAANA